MRTRKDSSQSLCISAFAAGSNKASAAVVLSARIARGRTSRLFLALINAVQAHTWGDSHLRTANDEQPTMMAALGAQAREQAGDGSQ